MSDIDEVKIRLDDLTTWQDTERVVCVGYGEDRAELQIVWRRTVNADRPDRLAVHDVKWPLSFSNRERQLLAEADGENIGEAARSVRRQLLKTMSAARAAIKALDAIIDGE